MLNMYLRTNGMSKSIIELKIKRVKICLLNTENHFISNFYNLYKEAYIRTSLLI